MYRFTSLIRRHNKQRFQMDNIQKLAYFFCSCSPTCNKFANQHKSVKSLHSQRFFRVRPKVQLCFVSNCFWNWQCVLEQFECEDHRLMCTFLVHCYRYNQPDNRIHANHNMFHCYMDNKLQLRLSFCNTRNQANTSLPSTFQVFLFLSLNLFEWSIFHWLKCIRRLLLHKRCFGGNKMTTQNNKHHRCTDNSHTSHQPFCNMSSKDHKLSCYLHREQGLKRLSLPPFCKWAFRELFQTIE